ncbi:MAG: rod shape-determining protein MreC [Fimbriimonadaceae bacterium]|nr:rod shape-determining protein MreC [Fimbriimonadaceae bacterium]QYK56751.1 MAG: rod shape-determining protein MreC [Fimbriimonadaceae bacterium]
MAALGVYQNRERSQGGADRVSATVRAGLLPAVVAINGQVRTWTDSLNASRKGPADEAELRRLRQLKIVWATYSEQTRRLQADIARLQKLLDQPNYGRERIAVRIAAYYPLENRFELLAGERQGLRPGLAVVGPHGLLGAVQTVEADRSQVLFVTSPALQIGALVESTPRVPGLIRGQTPRRLVMDVLDLGEIQPGSKVVTSGHGGTIPRGIEIGTVSEVVLDPSYGTRRVYVVPSADMAEVVEVWVLK